MPAPTDDVNEDLVFDGRCEKMRMTILDTMADWNAKLGPIKAEFTTGVYHEFSGRPCELIERK